jgi:hypothetical protein
MEPDYKVTISKSFVNKLNLSPQYKVANAAICQQTCENWCSMVLIDNHTYVRFVNPLSRSSLLSRQPHDDKVFFVQEGKTLHICCCCMSAQHVTGRLPASHGARPLRYLRYLRKEIH